MGIRRDTAAKSLGMKLRESATSSRTAARVDFCVLVGKLVFRISLTCTRVLLCDLNFISYILYLIQTRSHLLT